MSTQTTSGFDLDLDAQRAASREAKQQAPSLTIGGRRYELPIELPVDVFEPLTTLDVDASLLVSMALDARKEAQQNGEAATEAVLQSVVNMIVANPNLPMDLVEAIKTGALRLLGEDCYTALVGFRPSIGELGAIAKHLSSQYGVGLGEALPSSDSSDGTGETSKPTSRRGTRATTSGRSTGRRQTRGS